MSKIKKILISLGAFILATFTKIGGLISRAESATDSLSRMMLYGPPQPKPTTGVTLYKIAKPITLVIVFIIGVFVILSKKITKKVKIIFISILVILTILGYVLINYISTNV